MVDLNLQKYPVYKISGIEWLGDIPEHWEVKKLKRLVKKIIDGTHFTPNYVDEGIPFLRVTDIHGSSINMNNVRYISQKEHEQLSKRCNPEKGDVLLSKNRTIGITKVVDWDCPFSIFVSLCLLKPVFQDIDSYFLSYIFQGKIIDYQILESSKTTSVTNLHLDKIQNLTIVVPPLSEQQAIANFLDDKLAQIDEYIAKKQRMIELLKEQKTVIINQAVTKGINPDVPMKYSGIKWLGEIPENWEVKRLKFISHLVYGDSLGSENREDGNINVYGSNGMIGLHSKANTLSPVIIVGRKGSFGKIQYSLFPCFCIDTAYFIDQRKTKQNLKWLYYALQILELDKISQDTGVPGLSREKAYQKLVPLPPLSEQQAIANFLDDKLVKIDKCITVIEKEIKLTQEYRTTLISETVTGKIDVRKYHPPQ
jgi:type I restriction enzyme S subunit